MHRELRTLLSDGTIEAREVSGRSYPIGFKREVMRFCRMHPELSFARIATIKGVSESTVRRWQKGSEIGDILTLFF